MIQTIFSAILSFLSTNVDDLILLMILSGQAGINKVKKRHIWAGQYLAIGSITALGMIGALALGLLPDGFEAYLRYMGILPILIAAWHILQIFLQNREKHRTQLHARLKKAPNHTENTVGKVGIAQVFFLLFSAGVDNAGVYIPVFSKMNTVGRLTALAVFFVLTGALCWFAMKLANNKVFETAMKKYETVLVPIVLALIGLAMLVGI